MKLTPYKKLLTMSKDVVNKTLAPIRAARQKKSAELEMLKIEERISQLETDITEACSIEELNFRRIINLQNELVLAEHEHNQFKTIISELFPS